MFREILLSAFLVLQSVIVSAQHVKSLDITSAPSDTKYFIVVCGRNNSATGHAFLVWGKEDAVLKQSVVEGAFGLYPDMGNTVVEDGVTLVKAVFTKVPGSIADEFVKGSMTTDLIRMIVQVDKDLYDETFKIKDTWEGKDDYKFIENDCITFAAEVAKSTGLTVPERSTFDKPWTFIDKILTANNQADFLSGIWQSIDEQKRFKLEIKNTTCVWTERNATGATISRTADVKKEGSVYKIYRPNDNEVLTFLTFQPKLRTQILAKKPNPSYIELSRGEVGKMNGNWNGLIATKDAGENLKELKQPGTTPAKPFLFNRTY